MVTWAETIGRWWLVTYRPAAQHADSFVAKFKILDVVLSLDCCTKTRLAKSASDPDMETIIRVTTNDKWN